MQNVELLIHARYVIPVVPAGVLEHHSIAVDGGRIVALCPTATVAKQFRAKTEYDYREHAVIPGLVNTHTHAAMTLFRGLADDLPLMNWLQQHIWPAEAKHGSWEFVHDGTRLAVYEMLRGGTTCFNDMYFFPDAAATAASELGMRAVVGMIVIGFPTAWAQDTAEYFRNGQQVHDRYRDHPLIKTAFAPHAPYTVDDAALHQVAVLAEELDVPIQIHVHETAEEIHNALSATGARPLARLQRLGLLSNRLIAVHMTQLEDTEIEMIARSGVNVVHCPESNLKLASGMCPVGKLLAAGVNVALGTDGAASNNDLDLLGEARTAALLAKGVSLDPCVMPAASALEIATLGGARALGLDDEIGSITVGKQADLVAVDFSDPRLHPIYDPVSQLIYACGREQISAVWIGGKQVVESGRVHGIDPAQLRANAMRWQIAIRAPHPSD